MIWKRVLKRNRNEDELEKDSRQQEARDTGRDGDLAEDTGKTQAGLLKKLKQGLQKTRQTFIAQVERLIGSGELNDEFYEQLEELLIQADVGLETTLELVDSLREQAEKEGMRKAAEIRPLLKAELRRLLDQGSSQLKVAENGPTVYLLVGVNGSGKTTTIAKLAYRFKQEGKKVLLGAGDTFRAAAIDQLQVWADRLNVDLVKHQEGSDPAAVVFDSIAAAKSRGVDVLILDTAGRLQTQKNLMAELNKVYRVAIRELGRAPDEVLLVVDATTGQNAVSQAKRFGEAVELTGLVLTKLDGTAKGGIVISIAAEMGLPVKLIGVGEDYSDLRDFDPDLFIEALFA